MRARYLMTAAILSITAAAGAAAQAPSSAASAAAASTAANPLLVEWTTPEGVPPYDRITPAHYLPAYEEAMRRGRAELAAITATRAPATFENTILALDQGEQLLSRVDATFSNVASADATPEIEAVQEKVSPLLSRYTSEKFQNQALFARVDAVHRNRAGLNPEQRRLVEVMHKSFVRAGAALPTQARARLAAIDERMAALQTNFGQKLLADQKARDTLLTEAEVAGLSPTAKAAAAAKAKAAGKPGYLVSATRSDAESFLTAGTNRTAREKVWRAFAGRNDGGANTTYPIIAEMVRLRAERAKLLGFPSHAHFVLDNSVARTPEAARKLLVDVITPALAKAKAEEADLLTLARADGVTKIEPWDWRFYSDKVRQQRFALNDDEVRQYLRADNVMAAMFDTMTRLYDVTFVPRPDLPVYAPGVQAFQVNRQGQKAGIFFADWFARPTKRAGAWMNELRTQDGVRGLTPIVVNNSNYTPAPAGQVALLSVDDMETSFHEFGHALHGLLSKAKYPSLAGTAVFRDFVEFPSQVHEHWATEKDVLKRFAKNAAGEPMPDALIDKLRRASTFNQGYLTVQQLSSALVDLDLHSMGTIPADFDAAAFERAKLAELGVPESVGMRHRSPHFSHIFDGGYSAGYYAYTWAEVMDADGFAAFEETGDVWNKAVADRLRTEVLERGNTRDPAESYRAFRGRDPDPRPLLKNRGLVE